MGRLHGLGFLPARLDELYQRAAVRGYHGEAAGSGQEDAPMAGLQRRDLGSSTASPIGTGLDTVGRLDWTGRLVLPRSAQRGCGAGSARHQPHVSGQAGHGVSHSPRALPAAILIGVALALAGCAGAPESRDESLVRQAESRLTRLGTQGVMPSSVIGLGVLAGQMWSRWGSSEPTVRRRY